MSRISCHAICAEIVSYRNIVPNLARVGVNSETEDPPCDTCGLLYVICDVVSRRVSPFGASLRPASTVPVHVSLCVEFLKLC